MKSFKNFINEQHLAKGETTLDPDFLEKKAKRDRQIDIRIEEPNKEVDREAEQMSKEAE